MKITNNNNLPEPLYNAIVKTNAKYSKGEADYSTTQLIDSPRISVLKHEFWDRITEDASDMIWRFFGSLGHEVIANSDSWNVLQEERMYTQLEGKTISGCPDEFDGDLVNDTKITSKYSVRYGHKLDWERQLNIYRYILVDNKWEPKRLQVTAICRDAGKDDDKVVVLPVPMWGVDRAEDYIRQRIQKHEQAKIVLPLCTEEERWYSPRKFAVMKVGNKRALKLFSLKVEANLYMKMMQAKEKKVIYIDERPGESKRCSLYCICSRFCSQYLENKRGGG